MFFFHSVKSVGNTNYLYHIQSQQKKSIKIFTLLTWLVQWLPTIHWRTKTRMSAKADAKVRRPPADSGENSGFLRFYFRQFYWPLLETGDCFLPQQSATWAAAVDVLFSYTMGQRIWSDFSLLVSFPHSMFALSVWNLHSRFYTLNIHTDERTNTRS